MKHTFQYILICFLLTLCSCDPCDNLDCNGSNYRGQFRVVSKTSGKDLVFGTDAIYDKTKIRFYALNDSDTTFFKYSTERFAGTGYDSILYINFYPKTTTPIFMQLSETDTDTLNLSFETYNSRCCGTITEIKNYRYNNLIDIPGREGTQEIRK